MIDGVDFSEFLDNVPASRKTAAAPIPDPQPIREPVKTPEANKPLAPESPLSQKTCLLRTLLLRSLRPAAWGS